MKTAVCKALKTMKQLGCNDSKGSQKKININREIGKDANGVVVVKVIQPFETTQIKYLIMTL